MALIPEFISILRYIRDTVYPSVNQTYENAIDLNEEITTKKNEFNIDYSQFKNDYVDFNNSKIEISNAVISTNQSAQSASASALLATQKSNEIKNLTAQGQTLTAGSQAYASYNPADGKLTIGIPAGLKGEKGDSFTINSSGTTAQRALYNNQIKGWSFLDLETSTIYFKVSDASADWSLGAPFGKGDPGPEGEEGIGIVSFTFVSTTDTSGLPAQSGATDTYRITLTNSNTFDYQIYNGVDADSDFILGELATLNSEVEQLIEDTSGLSNIDAPYNLLKGEIYVDNTVLTNGFSTTLYSGTSASTDIVNDIDMDTQWGDLSDEKYGGLVWLKSRNTTTNHFLFDTIRGALNEINSNNTEINASLANSLTSFNSDGFTLNNASGINVTGSNYVSWAFGTTHRITGVTNHGKNYECHYNPFTGFTIVRYYGSGQAGHEIPHHLNNAIAFKVIKRLSGVDSWEASYGDSGVGYFNQNIAFITTDAFFNNEKIVRLKIQNNQTNFTDSQYIMYGWANSYFDKNKLIGNYEIGIYQGTGVTGNKINTRGKPAWAMIKRIDNTSSWLIFDNQRGTNPSKALYIELSNIESTPNPSAYIQFNSDSFNINVTTSESNAYGGQYLYVIAYDNDSGSGKSKYRKTTENTNIQINDALIPLAHGINNKGYKNNIVVANETITGLTYTAGINYLYKTDTGYGVKTYKPRYLKSELVRRFAGEQPDYYDAKSNKWFNCDAGIELVTNGTFSDGITTGWTASGGTLDIDSSRLKITVTGGAVANASQTINTTIGKKYKVVFTGTGENIYCYVKDSNNNILNGLGLGDGTWIDYSYEFTANTSTSIIYLEVSTVTAGYIGYYDNISVFAVDIEQTTEITEGRNYLNHIVYADNHSGVLYVEEIPKVEYKDIIKANEYVGKNACTAWCLFDATANPPVIKDAVGVKSIVRIGNYRFKLYHNLDNNNYTVTTSHNASSSSSSYFLDEAKIDRVVGETILDFRAYNSTADATTLLSNASVQIFGGKNV